MTVDASGSANEAYDVHRLLSEERGMFDISAVP